MADIDALLIRIEEMTRLLTRVIKDKKKILVVTHIDADGLSSGAIIFHSLIRKGASVSARAIPELDHRVIKELKSEGFDFFIFTDLASGMIRELSSSLGDSYIIIDHHQLPHDEIKNSNILNAWHFGYDGGSEACSSTMAYLLATSLSDDNNTLSYLAVIGALGDRQDSGTERSLIGLNRKALDDARSLDLVSVSKDILFYGRETRPIHETLALTYNPFISGLSGNKDLALAELTNAGLNLKDKGKWRTLSELSNEEKQKLLDIIARHISSAANGTELIAELIGEVYTLENEDSFTPLRDAREFATLLNACGRMDRPDIGLSICLGDRDDALTEALKIIVEYRSKLNKAIQALQSDSSKIEINGDLGVIVGDEIFDERMTGSISSILASTKQFSDKVVMVRARSGDSELKFSSRIGDSYSKEINLGLVMKEAAEQVGGVGGGHSMAAGAKIPFAKGSDFSNIVLQKMAK